MIRTLPGDAPTLTPAPNSSHPQVLETVMTLTKFMHLICLLSGDPCVCECFFTSIIFCDRHANNHMTSLRHLATDKLFVEGWVIHRIYDMPTEYLILKNKKILRIFFFSSIAFVSNIQVNGY